jgi:hypothetical protein
MATMARTVGMGLHAVTEVVSQTDSARVSRMKNLLLFFAAPFTGLAYIIAIPVIGFSVIARFGVRLALGNN